MRIYAAYNKLKLLAISNNENDLEPYLGEVLLLTPNFFTKKYINSLDYYYCSESDIRFKINCIEKTLQRNYTNSLFNRKQELIKLLSSFIKKRENLTLQFIEDFNDRWKLKKLYMKHV